MFNKCLSLDSLFAHFRLRLAIDKFQNSAIKMFINSAISSTVSCIILIILPVSIQGSMGRINRERSNQMVNYSPISGDDNDKFVSKRHVHHHGHIIETPLTEEVALITEQHPPARIVRPGSTIEVIEEVIHEPRYSSPPTDHAIITHGPLITPPHHHNHLHLVPLRPVINPSSHIHHHSAAAAADIHTATKVVEVSAIHSGTGHTQRLGAFAVQPILDHLHTGVIRNEKFIVNRGQPKSRVEMFHTQQQIETLDDPVDDLSSPSHPNNQPIIPTQSTGYYGEIQQQQQQQEQTRLSLNEERGRRSRLNKFNKNHHQSEAIIEQSPIVEEKVTYASLVAANGHLNPHHHAHLQPGRLVIEDNHLNHHHHHHHTSVSPSAAAAALIAEHHPNQHQHQHQHHHHRLVELKPVVTPVAHLHVAQAARPAHLHILYMANGLQID